MTKNIVITLAPYKNSLDKPTLAAKNFKKFLANLPTLDITDSIEFERDIHQIRTQNQLKQPYSRPENRKL
jgi:hypothetical protein